MSRRRHELPGDVDCSLGVIRWRAASGLHTHHKGRGAALPGSRPCRRLRRLCSRDVVSPASCSCRYHKECLYCQSKLSDALV